MSGWFELSKTSDGQFRFSLKADEKETLLASETYRTRSSAEGGIASVRSNCGQDGRYEKKVAGNGSFFFNLKAGNGEVIGTSRMYPTAEARDAAIAAAKAAGASTTVRDNA
ncbi:MAG TPA: YegP family protein [Ramlibacter sp.]